MTIRWDFYPPSILASPPVLISCRQAQVKEDQMKRCPKCNSIYTNDQLVYCLADGAVLESSHTFDSAPTMVANPSFNIPPVISQKPPVISQQQEKVGRGILSIALIIMLAAGVVIGLLIAFILLRPAATTTTSLQPAQNQNNSNISVTNNTQAKPRETATTPSPAAKPSTAAANSTSSQDVRWFVVLGTFQASDSAGANSRLEQMRAEGFKDAYIVDTNGYSNFTPDRLAVVLGPYTESGARSVGSRVRSLNPTIKPGW